MLILSNTLSTDTGIVQKLLSCSGHITLQWFDHLNINISPVLSFTILQNHFFNYYTQRRLFVQMALLIQFFAM